MSHVRNFHASHIFKGARARGARIKTKGETLAGGKCIFLKEVDNDMHQRGPMRRATVQQEHSQRRAAARARTPSKVSLNITKIYKCVEHEHMMHSLARMHAVFMYAHATCEPPSAAGPCIHYVQRRRLGGDGDGGGGTHSPRATSTVCNLIHSSSVKFLPAE